MSTELHLHGEILSVVYHSGGETFAWSFPLDQSREGLAEICKASQWPDVPYTYEDVAEVTSCVREFLIGINHYAAAGIEDPQRPNVRDTFGEWIVRRLLGIN